MDTTDKLVKALGELATISFNLQSKSSDIQHATEVVLGYIFRLGIDRVKLSSDVQYVVGKLLAQELPQIETCIMKLMDNFPGHSYYHACVIRSGIEFLLHDDFRKILLGVGACKELDRLQRQIDLEAFDFKFKHWYPGQDYQLFLVGTHPLYKNLPKGHWWFCNCSKHCN